MATQQIRDILDTEIPKPSFVLRPSVAAPLPSDVTHSRSGADNVARTLDPYSGTFEQVAEDTPRVYGDDQGLLLESDGRTNYVPRSSSINSIPWNSGGIGSEVARSSIINGKDAYEITGDGSNTCFVIKNTGTFSGDTEVAHYFIEQGTSNEVQVAVKNAVSGNRVFLVRYFWDTGGFNIKEGSANVRVRTLDESGPNGKSLVQIICQYEDSNNDNISGDPRNITIFPDRKSDGVSNIFHHAQIEEAPNASSPIVTDGTKKTRSGDNANINLEKWWNENQGTIIMKVSPQYYRTTYSADGLLRKKGSTECVWARIKNPPPPFTLRTNPFSGPSNIIDISDAVPPFQDSTIAISASRLSNILRVSVNGSSTVKSADVSNMLGSKGDTLRLTSFEGANALYKQIRYLPRALPESTLNTLTT